MRRTAAAVGLAAVGGGVVLVLLGLTWVDVRVDRAAPFPAVTAQVGGRTVAPALFGLALTVAAGAVAVLATRGLARRVVGVLVALAGVGAVVGAVTALGRPTDAAARAFAAQAVADRAGTDVVPLTGGTVTVAGHPVWPVLAALAALLAVAGGVLAASADRSRGLGARYEAPVAAVRPRDESMWSALDHGDDPTAAAGPDTDTDTDVDTDTDTDTDTDVDTDTDTADPNATGNEHDADRNRSRDTA